MIRKLCVVLSVQILLSTESINNYPPGCSNTSQSNVGTDWHQSVVNIQRFHFFLRGKFLFIFLAAPAQHSSVFPGEDEKKVFCWCFPLQAMSQLVTQRCFDKFPDRARRPATLHYLPRWASIVFSIIPQSYRVNPSPPPHCLTCTPRSIPHLLKLELT